MEAGVTYRIVFAFLNPDGTVKDTVAAVAVKGGEVLPPCRAGGRKSAYILVDARWPGAADALGKLLSGDASAVEDILRSARKEGRRFYVVEHREEQPSPLE